MHEFYSLFRKGNHIHVYQTMPVEGDMKLDIIEMESISVGPAINNLW